MSTITNQNDNPTEYFPARFASEIRKSLEDLLADHQIVLRPLRSTDPSNVVGIFPGSWVPSNETAMIGQYEVPISTYIIKIQNMIKHLDEAQGRAMFSAIAKAIRAILYRDPDLRVRLGGLEEQMLSTVERVKRYGVSRQDFLSNEVPGAFVFLAITDVFIETETTAL